MCGRYVSSRSAPALAERFAAEADPDCDHVPSWNVTPTSSVPVIVGGDRPAARRLELFRWGLVPSWADSPAGAARINARAETAERSAAFREPLARRRCIVPVDGFYEWERRPAPPGVPAPGRVPHYFCRPDGDVLALAGIWDVWHDPAGAVLRSFALLTGAAAAPVEAVHDRMPLVLAPSAWAAWLDQRPVDVASLLADQRRRMEQAPAGELASWPVSTAVNSTRNDGPRLVEPAAAAPTPLSLFG